MQKFKHNTNIWIWNYCLLKIYLNTESWWLQVVDSRGMTLTQKENYKRIFLNSQDFLKLSNYFFLQLTLTELLNPCRPLPDEESWSSFYRWGFRLQMNLQSWKFFNSITCMPGGAFCIRKSERRKRRDILFFPMAPRCFPSELVDKIYCSLLFTFWLIGIFFFYYYYNLFLHLQTFILFTFSYFSLFFSFLFF